MPMFTIIADKTRRLPDLWKADILAGMRSDCISEIEQEEERCLEGMLHWHDPSERPRDLRRRSHTLVEDNPASG